MERRRFRAAHRGASTVLAVCGLVSWSTRFIPNARAADSVAKNALDPQPISGTVLKLDAGDVVIDLGAKKGAVDGNVLELWRPITVKHPVTGKTLSDRFRIGAIELTQVGEVMSLAKPHGPLLRPIEAGDVVLLPAKAKPPVAVVDPTSTTTKTPVSPTSTTTTGSVVPDDDDPEARALSTLFEALSGQGIEIRIERYEAYVRVHPDSRFARVLLEEARHLRSLLEGGTVVAGQPVALSFAAPKEVLAGSSLTFSVEIGGPTEGAVLHLRLDDEPAFSPMPMHASGVGYYSVTLPEERVAGSSLSFFIEAVNASGGVVPMVASSSSPAIVKVVPAPKIEPPRKYEATFSLWTDYADYNRLRGNDYAWQTEGYFDLRFSDVGVRAVRSGFGVYKGKGGAIGDLDVRTPPLDPRTVGLSYGYIEGEFGLTAAFSVIARAVVGLGEDGVTGGGQAFIRIGNDKKTNFMIGGEFLGGIGVRGITQVELNMFPRIPIVLRSEVTNQPAGTKPDAGRIQDLAGKSVSATDLGVRAIVQAGYRVTPNLTFFLRGSYQGRTINHAGPGAGAGMTFSW